MTTDLRELITADSIRLHPRIAYQSIVTAEQIVEKLSTQLPAFTPFKNSYAGGIAIVDWDHKLPSKGLIVRLYGYYDGAAFDAGEEAFDDRLEEIGERDRFPEFDVPDFDDIAADEAYELQVNLELELSGCRLTSAWRRQISAEDCRSAVDIAEASSEYKKLKFLMLHRPKNLGELEAVSWTPPCETQHDDWTIDVWYLTSFDGRMGNGRSFLVDLKTKKMISSRDFSVRTA